MTVKKHHIEMWSMFLIVKCHICFTYLGTRQNKKNGILSPDWYVIMHNGVKFIQNTHIWLPRDLYQNFFCFTLLCEISR